MRNLVLASFLLVATTGCGRGWLSNFFHGAPCHTGYCSAPMIDDCQGCASAGYEMAGPTITEMPQGFNPPAATAPLGGRP